MGIFSRTTSKKFKVNKAARAPLLPPSFQAFLARRVTDVGGGMLLTAGGVLILSFASYTPTDPSFNSTSQDHAVQNWLGTFGAYTADVMLQTLGLGAVALSAALSVWGYRILRRKPLDHLGGKVSLLLIATLTAAIALARVPAFESWGIGSYLGGSAGALILNALGNAIQPFMGAMSFLFIGLASGLIFSVTYLLSLGVSLGEWGEGLSGARGGVSFLREKLSAATNAFQAWHGKYSGYKAKSLTIKKPRVQMDADAVSKEKDDDVEIAPDLSAPVRKPLVTFRKDKEKPAEKKEPRQTKLNLRTEEELWQLPTLDLLEDRQNATNTRLDEAALQKNAVLLQSTLNDFSVYGDITKVSPGPIVTLYEMEPAPGTKTSRVIGLSHDIARSMSAISVRVAVVPGKNAIGIELPNAKRETVFLKEMLASDDYAKATARLPLVLGKNIAGDPVIADLAKMPHLLVAGTTGSGKSVAVNTMILSLLYRLSPEQCRFIMIDPKMLELSVYDDIPHLLTPVVTEPHRAIVALKWAVREMEDRYRAMSKLGVRNIDGFNERLRAARASGEILMHKIQTGFDMDTGKPVYEEQPISQVELPYIVIIVDEFADLMLVAGKEVENAIQRLAQMARAAGIHLIMATQRPSVDVITGVIKANFPTRISFQVTSKIDSRTILGDGGAEQLLGQGDMLYMASGGRITRVHGPFVADDEVEKIVKYLRSQGTPNYIDGVTEDDEEEGVFGGGDDDGGASDALYDQAVQIVLRERKASTSFIQRHLQIGYNRAARLIERMEKEGLISAANHVGKREILVDNYGT